MISPISIYVCVVYPIYVYPTYIVYDISHIYIYIYTWYMYAYISIYKTIYIVPPLDGRGKI